MSNVVITGSIIAAQKRKEHKMQVPLQYQNSPYSLEYLAKRKVNPIKFGMGWREDIDDVTLRLNKM